MRFCSLSTPSLWRGGTVEAWASQDLQDRICGSLPLIPRARPKGGTARGWRGSQHAIRRPHLRHQIFRNSSADRFFQSPAPDRREEQRGGGGGASMRSADHIFDTRSSGTAPRIASFIPPRPTAGRNSEGVEGELACDPPTTSSIADLQEQLRGSLHSFPRARPKGGTARGRRGSQHAIRSLFSFP